MAEQTSLPESPKWDPTTKMVIGLAIVAIFVVSLIYFRNIIGPLILAFILAFLLQPIAAWGSRLTGASWKLAVNVLYLLLVAILAILVTLTGLALVQQAQSLINSIERFVNQLPEMVQNFSTQSYMIGPFQFDFSHIDLETLVTQLPNSVQPILGQAGSIVSRVATSAATTAGWGIFVLLVSYFLLSESGQIRQNLVRIDIPGYGADMHRLGNELAKIWDSFLRGQLVISILVVISYYILLTILGTRLTLAIAILAGLARFIPYVGPLVTWTVTAIVAFLQTSNYFGLEPIQYAALVVGLCLILDLVYDNLVVPRFLGQTLGVHPAGVLVAAIVAATLIGIIGLILAAPVLATLVLLGRYVFRKMFDLDPWPEEEMGPKHMALPWTRTGLRLLELWDKLREGLKRKRGV